MKTLIANLALFTVALTLPLQAEPKEEKNLYERLGGVFAIAAVVDHFSDAVVQNPIVGKESKNPALRKWHTKSLDRLPGLKFMRTQWVCAATGGPFKYSPTKPGKTELGLEEAHRDLKISSEEFDEVAAELGRSLDFAKMPAPEKKEVLAAFAAHKKEVTAGTSDTAAPKKEAADNAARNKDDKAPTPMDQGNSKADIATTAQIRKEVMALDNLTLTAKNVKIITNAGKVTLRGPVNTAAEKQSICEIADRIAKAENVDSQLEVKPASDSKE